LAVSIRPDRRSLVGVPQEPVQVLLLARIERAADDLPARRLCLADQRLQPVAPPPPDENDEPFGGELLAMARLI